MDGVVNVEIDISTMSSLLPQLQSMVENVNTEIEFRTVEPMTSFESHAVIGGTHHTTSTIGFSSWQHATAGTSIFANRHGNTGNITDLSGNVYPFVDDSVTGGVDAGIWDTDQAVENQVYVGGGNVSNITGQTNLNNQPIGGSVCKYGKVTGYTCGVVENNAYVHPTIGGNMGRVLRDTMKGESGDSGGPVKINQSAYGVFHGAIGNATTHYLVYSGISRVEATLAAQLYDK